MPQPAPLKPTLCKPSHLMLLLMLLFMVPILAPDNAMAATICSGVTEIPVAECEALEALYNSTDGPNWPQQSGWLTTNTPCTWYGVECLSNTLPKHITHLRLPSNQLSGNLPAQIGNLTELQALELRGNQLTSLPAEIGKLINLRFLYLDDNELRDLPKEIGALSNLNTLDLFNNQLSTLPAEIGNLANLTWLRAASNQLSALPAEIGNLSSLVGLEVYDNQLQSLPAEIGHLSHLTHLFLDNNQLGSLPAEIGNLTSLQALYLSSNQVRALPDEIGNLSNLQTLDLMANQLSASPAEIGNLTTLEWLKLANNQVSALPSEIGHLLNLHTLEVQNNRLQSLPSEVSKLSNLVNLNLASNQLHSLPVEFSVLSDLANLAINSNPSLAGPLPAELLQLTGLVTFYFHDTALCEPGDTAFQNWLATIPDLRRTGVICESTSSVTITLEAQPNHSQDFFFAGDLGFFKLDALSDDGDAHTHSKTFEVGAGTYTVNEHVPGNFVLTSISCEQADGSTVDLASSQVTIALADDAHITCTFVNLRRSIVRSVSYKDNNQNGTIEAFEAPLNQWRVSYYDAQGNFYTGSPEGPTTNNLTNQQGKDGISNIPPGSYTICEEVKDGWFNTLPGTVHPTYGQPCYEVTVAPGKIVEVYFGNTDYPLANRTQAYGSGSGVVVRDAPDTEDELDDEEWLNAPLQQLGLFLPMITTQK